MHDLLSLKNTAFHSVTETTHIMKNWISREKLGLKWAISFGFWILLGVFFALKTYFYSHIIEQPIDFWQAASYMLPKAIVWGAVTPIVIWGASNYRIDGSDWLRNTLTHLGIIVVLSPFLVIISFLIGLLIQLAIHALPDNPSFVIASFNAQIFANSFDNSITYIIIVGVYHVYDYYTRYRDRELKNARLEAQLANTRLDLLKAQLNPHFLFNTLNAISTVKDYDLDAADGMITDLSEMLRFIMDNIHRKEVTLREEIDFLRRYISLQKRRFDEQLDIVLNIDPDAWNAMVPSLMLQPLVENAIEHGVRNNSDKGYIEIECNRLEQRLHFRIHDNGPGLNPKKTILKKGRGIGLENTRERLNNLYGDNYEFELKNAKEGGALVILDIPYRWENIKLSLSQLKTAL